MRRKCPERFPRHRLQRKPLVSDPGIHHRTCMTHVPWCMSASLTRGGEESAPGPSGACATHNFTYLARCPYNYILQDPLLQLTKHHTHLALGVFFRCYWLCLWLHLTQRHNITPISLSSLEQQTEDHIHTTSLATDSRYEGQGQVITTHYMRGVMTGFCLWCLRLRGKS